MLFIIDILVVSLFLYPTTRLATEKIFPCLVVDEDEYGEGDGGEPPGEGQGVHAQDLVHPRGVGEEGCQGRLEKQTKVHHLVPHPLLE